jgi:hypothetical protein
MTQNLYHYTNEFLEVKAKMDMLGVDDETYADTLEAYEANITDKMENLIKYQKELLALAAIQKEAAKELTEAAKVKEAKAKRLKEYMDQNMKVLKLKSIQAGPYSLGYKKGSEVTVVDESLLPKKYWVDQPSIPMGKPELKKLVQSGTEIEGVQIVRNPDSLVIKV